MSLTIAAGEKVAVVGKTGSGKTTLARLLVRFYDPNHGIITMDGTDLRQFSFDSLYRQISYVTQEVPVFSGTIGENVRFGLAECGEDRVMDACTHASANFVFQQKQGLATKVGELGEKLSGGERQRLALARVFLRHPSVLILDEATAALDQMTEREVQAAFDRLLQMNGGTTMVVIAHRITTVKNADRIVVLGQGRVIDAGTHKELLDRCELYQELCRGMTTPEGYGQPGIFYFDKRPKANTPAVLGGRRYAWHICISGRGWHIRILRWRRAGAIGKSRRCGWSIWSSAQAMICVRRWLKPAFGLCASTSLRWSSFGNTRGRKLLCPTAPD